MHLKKESKAAFDHIAQVVSDKSELLHLREENKTLYNSVILVGTVNFPESRKVTPIVVAAYSKRGGKRTIAHYTTIHEPGPYELMVPAGNWYIVAFADANKDYAYEEGETAGQYSKTPLAVDHGGGVVLNLNILLRNPGTADLDFPPGTAVTPNRPKTPHFTSPGTICTLDDPLFDEANGREGFWQPSEFFKKFGGNIYFLEPYAPAKIPILFVHGATGTPKGWKFLVKHIDRNRFQPWFYYYPSGASIKAMADLLFWKMFNLKNKYRFNEMYLVADSMGGLVVRSFLVDYGKFFPSIKKFISISTPWGGDSLAKYGVEYSPGVIPVWRDMVPDGVFAQSIYRKKLPPGVDYYLFFGYRGNRNPLRPNNDGVVTISTQLDPRVQAEAKMVYGFDEDHSSILNCPRAAALFTNIINADPASLEIQSKRSTGMLRLAFSKAMPSETPSIWAQVHLLPKDRTQKGDILLTVNALESGHLFGPFPSGRYTVRLIAQGFRAKPVEQTVAIAPEQSAVSTFQLIPSGSVTGFITRQFYNDSDPAGIFMGYSHDLPVRSIRLTGMGVERELTPSTKKSFDVFAHYRTGTDWAYENAFAFYNLPQGTYLLTVEARGYAPYHEQRMVVPGRADSAADIEIQLVKNKPPQR